MGGPGVQIYLSTRSATLFLSVQQTGPLIIVDIRSEVWPTPVFLCYKDRAKGTQSPPGYFLPFAGRWNGSFGLLVWCTTTYNHAEISVSHWALPDYWLTVSAGWHFVTEEAGLRTEDWGLSQLNRKLLSNYNSQTELIARYLIEINTKCINTGINVSTFRLVFFHRASSIFTW